MVTGVFGPKTPKHSIAVAIEIHGFVAFSVVAAATSTNRFAAAIVIRHQVITAVHRIATGANPSDR